MAWDRILANDGDAEALSVYRQLFSDSRDLEGRNLSALHRIVLCLVDVDLQTYLQRCSRAEIDQGDDMGRTALDWAVQRGDLVNVELLLRYGANPNKVSRYGSISLHYVARSGHVNIVDLLLKYGVDVNHGDNSMLTPLIMLCGYREDHPTCVQRLIDGGANINAQEFQGATALIFASQGGLLSTLQLLLENGGAPDLPTFEGVTPLIEALQANSHGAISILIAHGANLTYHTPSGHSLLHSAAEFADEASLVILTSIHIRGIDVNHRSKDGATAWDLARARNDISPEWRAAFADLVASITSCSPEPSTAEPDSELSVMVIPVSRIRPSDLIRIVEDNVHHWTIQVSSFVDAILKISFLAGFLVLVVLLAFAWRIAMVS